MYREECSKKFMGGADPWLSVDEFGVERESESRSPLGIKPAKRISRFVWACVKAVIVDDA